MRNYQVITAVFVSLLLAQIVGCSSVNTQSDHTYADHGHIKIDRINSSSAKITHAYLEPAQDALILRGVVEKRHNARGVTPGHLHVEVIDTKGQVIDDSVVCYQLKCRKTGTSKFVYETRVKPADISMMRISHHNSHSH